MLDENGGPTLTMLPLAGSPLFNPAGGDTSTMLSTDQRGFARLSGPRVDIGAVEVFDNSALIARLKTQIKRLKKKLRIAKRKKQVAKVKRLKKKIRKLRVRLRRL